MKKLRTISEQDRKFLDQLDALMGGTEPSPAELAAEMKECGIDPGALKESSFRALRAHATNQYSSKGLSLPPAMSEALKQLRPPTPEQQEAARAQTATSRVQNFLASLKGVGESLSVDQSFAPAFRAKEEETPDSDEEILRRQQEDLDSNRGRKRND